MQYLHAFYLIYCNFFIWIVHLPVNLYGYGAETRYSISLCSCFDHCSSPLFTAKVKQSLCWGGGGDIIAVAVIVSAECLTVTVNIIHGCTEHLMRLSKCLIFRTQWWMGFCFLYIIFGNMFYKYVKWFLELFIFYQFNNFEWDDFVFRYVMNIVHIHTVYQHLRCVS